jgi:hypothetical protein
MKRILAIGLIGLFTSAAAWGSPVYLECAVSNGSTAVTWNITMDEATGNVSYSIPSVGASSRYHGVFTQDSVTFDTVEISRTDLTFKRTVTIAGSIKSETGLCKVVQRPIRKF